MNLGKIQYALILKQTSLLLLPFMNSAWDWQVGVNGETVRLRVTFKGFRGKTMKMFCVEFSYKPKDRRTELFALSLIGCFNFCIRDLLPRTTTNKRSS